MTTDPNYTENDTNCEEQRVVDQIVEAAQRQHRNMQVSSYASHYSEQGFWQKVYGHTQEIGRALLLKAFQLYYTGISPNTPAWAKAIAFGALGYLILPLDAVPDLIPGFGFADDAAALAAALATLAGHIDAKSREQAHDQVRRIDGDRTN